MTFFALIKEIMFGFFSIFVRPFLFRVLKSFQKFDHCLLDKNQSNKVKLSQREKKNE